MTSEFLPIELRGHHLSLFGDYYLRSIERPADAKGAKVVKERRRYKLTDLFKEGSIFSETEGDEIIDEDSDFITRKYGPRIKKYMNNLWQRMIDHPETKVKLVQGYDSICKFAGVRKCPNYDKSACGPQGFADDMLTIDELDLEQGRTYTSAEIIANVVQYRKKSRFRTPKEKFLHLLQYFHPEDQDDITDEEIDEILNRGNYHG